MRGSVPDVPKPADRVTPPALKTGLVYIIFLWLTVYPVVQFLIPGQREHITRRGLTTFMNSPSYSPGYGENRPAEQTENKEYKALLFRDNGNRKPA